jgi:hypothetical protein
MTHYRNARATAHRVRPISTAYSSAAHEHKGVRGNADGTAKYETLDFECGWDESVRVPKWLLEYAPIPRSLRGRSYDLHDEKSADVNASSINGAKP